MKRDRPQIERFEGDHAFLSNFFPCDVDYLGVQWPSAEHAYQASKATPEDSHRVKDLILDTWNPGAVKAFGKKIKLRPDWELIKLTVMLRILRAKFSPRGALAERLAATEGIELVEGNTWGDTYWGECRGKGENNLGKLLMQVRYELLSDRQMRMSTTNPAYWIMRLRTLMHLSECRDKVLGIENATNHLEAILSKHYAHVREEIQERIR